ncbi:MAG: hypothetical protein QXL15_00110 [Candidatus Korarchaeota archaeon]
MRQPLLLSEHIERGQSGKHPDDALENLSCPLDLAKFRETFHSFPYLTKRVLGNLCTYLPSTFSNSY